MAFSPGGKRFAAGSHDHTVGVWDLESRQRVVSLAGHSKRVQGVDFSPDGSLLASAGGESVILWNSDTWQIHKRIDVGARGVQFSPDGKRLVIAGQDGKVQIWRTASGKLSRAIPGHRGLVFDAAFSPDGTKIASGGKDRTVRA